MAFPRYDIYATWESASDGCQSFSEIMRIFKTIAARNLLWLTFTNYVNKVMSVKNFYGTGFSSVENIFMFDLIVEC